MHFFKSIVLELALAIAPMGSVPIAASATIHCQGDCAGRNEVCYSYYAKIPKMPCCDNLNNCIPVDQFGYTFVWNYNTLGSIPDGTAETLPDPEDPEKQRKAAQASDAGSVFLLPSGRHGTFESPTSA
ncbi:hypothetical protein B0H19DRAFT_1262549 [Mycena capillaripes]|nr:hypothetical protein B0H19DRAFT_1262549 [Mycena capillaripes]